MPVLHFTSVEACMHVVLAKAACYPVVVMFYYNLWLNMSNVRLHLQGLSGAFVFFYSYFFC